MKSRKILAAVMAPVCAVSAMAVVASATDASTNTETVMYTGSQDLGSWANEVDIDKTKVDVSTAVRGDSLTIEYTPTAGETEHKVQFNAKGGTQSWKLIKECTVDESGKAIAFLTEEEAALLAGTDSEYVAIKGTNVILTKVTFTHYAPSSDVVTEMFSGSAALAWEGNGTTLRNGNLANAVAGDILTLKYTSTDTNPLIKLVATVGSKHTWTPLPSLGTDGIFNFPSGSEATITLTAEDAALLAGADTHSIICQGQNATLTEVTFTHKGKKAEESSTSSTTSSESSTTSSESSTTSSESSTTSSESSTTSSESSTTTSSESSTTTSESKPATSDEDKPAGDDKTDSTDKTETPGATDKAETVTNTVTVDKVLKGAELSKAVFGDSKKEWKDVETITFESDEPFAVVFDVKAGKIKGDDKATTFVKGVNELAKADLPAEAFATKWTLSKDEVAAMLEADPTGENTQIISKDGKKIQVKATVTLKADAASDDKTDNKNTGIALAVAPVILAGAAVAVVSLKKRK